MSLQEKIDQMKAQFESQAPPKSWISWIRCNPGGKVPGRLISAANDILTISQPLLSRPECNVPKGVDPKTTYPGVSG